MAPSPSQTNCPLRKPEISCTTHIRHFRLDPNFAICDHLRVTCSCQTDPTLAVAERQLAMLGELAEMAMAASRAFTVSAIASARAAEAVLDDKFFMPEVGRANACGAKDAAESIQKVTRAVRLTLRLEMKVAEIMRDIRAGIVTYSGGVAHLRDAGGTPADQGGLQGRRRPAGSCSPDRDRDETDRPEADRIEFDRPETLPRALFRKTVEQICADIGVTVDWNAWTVGRREAGYPDPPPKRTTIPGQSDRVAALSP